MDTQPSPPMASGQVTPQVEDSAPLEVAPVPQVDPVSQVAQVLPVPPLAQVPMGFFIVTAMQAYPGFEPYMSLKVPSYVIFVWGFSRTKVKWLLI